MLDILRKFPIFHKIFPCHATLDSDTDGRAPFQYYSGQKPRIVQEKPYEDARLWPREARSVREGGKTSKLTPLDNGPGPQGARGAAINFSTKPPILTCKNTINKINYQLMQSANIKISNAAWESGTYRIVIAVPPRDRRCAVAFRPPEPVPPVAGPGAPAPPRNRARNHNFVPKRPGEPCVTGCRLCGVVILNEK